MSDNFDRFLHEYRHEPDAQFAANLHRRLQALDTAPAQPRRWFWSRWARRDAQESRRHLAWKPRLAVAFMLLALLVGAATISPLRALATDILQQLGILSITNDPTMTERDLAQPYDPNAPQSEGIWLSGIGPFPSAAELSDQVGFAVYAPEWLPDGTSIIDRDALPLNGPPGRFSSVTLIGASAQAAPISLSQQPLETVVATEIPVGSAATSRVSVGDNEGVWIERTAWASRGSDVVYLDVLIWNADGFTFTLTSEPGIGLATLTAIAESLAPAR